MTPFTINEIELLLAALDAWESTARNEIATRVTQDVTERALQEVLDGATESKQEIIARLTQQNFTYYTPTVVRKMIRERNEEGVLLKARLIIMKQEIEGQLIDRIGEELFTRKGDESDV